MPQAFSSILRTRSIAADDLDLLRPSKKPSVARFSKLGPTRKAAGAVSGPIRSAISHPLGGLEISTACLADTAVALFLATLVNFAGLGCE